MAHGIEIPLKFDRATLEGDYGHFARMLIDVDLSKPLPDSIMIEVGEDCLFPILYFENVPSFCSMPKNSIVELWRFLDHENWVPVSVNSGSKRLMITRLKSVLQKFGLVEKFKQGPFGKYLDLKEPLKIYGQLIHNILKREIIHPKGQREDEMWFGLGKSKARFGQEEFCVCSGLNMGQLPEGFANNNEVEEDSLLKRIFKGKRPTAKLLYATLRKMTSEQSEDMYKMLNIYMVSQFFGTDDGRTTSILGWLFSLVENKGEFKNFPWGSYIFRFTLYFLKAVLHRQLSQLRGEAKKGGKNGKL
ncbi:hypothetical protein LWI29_019691 [Acer saccharum]|uniref:DUF1985 domain-containing protein n=1 Tax=Acer saccharum TaxID=4024 RepID=A0AA39S9C3_ACESA|nr:hypothetical protein LWI29_019691 [Acer saccharum]